MKGFKVFSLMLLVMMFTLNFAQAAPDIGIHAKIKLAPMPVINHFTLPGTEIVYTYYPQLKSEPVLSPFNDHLAPDPFIITNSYNNAAIEGLNMIWVIPLKTVYFIYNTKLNSNAPTINKSDRVKYRCKQ